jgi:cytochrome c oxidase subunit 2
VLNHSLFNPVSPQDNNISNLFNVTIVIALVVFALVLGVLLYAMVKFRAKPGAAEPFQHHGVRGLEIA